MNTTDFSVNPILKSSRKDFSKHVLLERDCSGNPIEQFEAWLTVAVENDGHFANAMTLSTVNESGMPDSRTVLLRNISHGGLTFFTNYKSAKGIQLGQNPKACLLFFWKELERQVKIQGEIRRLPPAESDEYFRSRPFESQVGAWASQQSKVVESRKALDDLFELERKEYSGKVVPRPSHWGGYVLVPEVFEFWQGRQSRLHDRIRYRKLNNKIWKLERLMP